MDISKHPIDTASFAFVRCVFVLTCFVLFLRCDLSCLRFFVSFVCCVAHSDTYYVFEFVFAVALVVVVFLILFCIQDGHIADYKVCLCWFVCLLFLLLICVCDRELKKRERQTSADNRFSMKQQRNKKNEKQANTWT